MRAMVMKADGTSHTSIGAELADDPNAWTQFAGWSPDGRQAIILRGWQDPENALWEEAHRTFRMAVGKWLLDIYLIDLESGVSRNLSAIDRVSHYNAGLFFISERVADERTQVARQLGFTALIDGVSKPFVMDIDGHNKRDVSGESAGFTYGYSASPDGRKISYHENYQVFVAQVDGSGKQRIDTGNAFNFAPSWSPDGKWLLFLSGEHYNCHPYIVASDGTELRKLADRQGYRGVTEFLDVDDFHGGSSDLPVWSADGKSVYYTAQVGDNIELFQITLMGEPYELTHSPPGTSHYHPVPSADGQRLLYGSRRAGVRQLMLMDLSTRAEKQLTQLEAGHAAMWPHWQPSF